MLRWSENQFVDSNFTFSAPLVTRQEVSIRVGQKLKWPFLAKGYPSQWARFETVGLTNLLDSPQQKGIIGPDSGDRRFLCPISQMERADWRNRTTWVSPNLKSMRVYPDRVHSRLGRKYAPLPFNYSEPPAEFRNLATCSFLLVNAVILFPVWEMLFRKGSLIRQQPFWARMSWTSKRLVMLSICFLSPKRCKCLISGLFSWPFFRQAAPTSSIAFCPDAHDSQHIAWTFDIFDPHNLPVFTTRPPVALSFYDHILNWPQRRSARFIYLTI